MIILDYRTPTDFFIKTIVKSFSRHIELKSEISKKIRNTRGGEQLMWIRKYNASFINNWK